MYLTMAILGCWAVGQAPQPAVRDPFSLTPTPANAPQPTAPAGQAAPVSHALAEQLHPAQRDPVREGRLDSIDHPTPATSGPSRRHRAPPEMIAEALAPPEGAKLSGQPFSLLAALSSTPDRRRQQEITHGYWWLVEAVATYHFAWQHDNALNRLVSGPGQAPAVRSARASAAALLHEAEAAAVAAQHELAALALLPSEASLPLPSDRPHVGAYLTQFETLFAARAAPPQAKLMERTLPIRCRAIEARAAAVEAAEEALKAAESTAAGPVRAQTVVACLEELSRQRQAFASSVCRYNHDIAEYAFTVAAPGIRVPALVRMLVEPSEEPLRPIPMEPSSGVDQAGFTQPVPTPARRPANVPTLAPRRAAPLPPEQPRPSPAERWTPAASNDPAASGGGEPLSPATEQRDGRTQRTPAAEPRMVPVEEPAAKE